MNNTYLTTGNVFKSISIFAGPMLIGNILQQLYRHLGCRKIHKLGCTCGCRSRVCTHGIHHFDPYRSLHGKRSGFRPRLRQKRLCRAAKTDRHSFHRYRYHNRGHHRLDCLQNGSSAAMAQYPRGDI